MDEGRRQSEVYHTVGSSRAEMRSSQDDDEKTEGIDAIVDPETEGGMDAKLIAEEEKAGKGDEE